MNPATNSTNSTQVQTPSTNPASEQETGENDGREGPAVSEIELAVKGVGTKEMGRKRREWPPI
jgi:hypothetical protein